MREALGHERNANSAPSNDNNHTLGINVTDSVNNPEVLAHKLDGMGETAHDPKSVLAHGRRDGKLIHCQIQCLSLY